MPDVRAAVPGVVGRTFICDAGRDGITARNAGPKRFGNGNIKDLMLAGGLP